MLGTWVAECRLCKFSERHVLQDDALTSAVKHAFANHPDEQASIKTGGYVVHVMQRSENALGFEVPPSPETPATETQVQAEETAAATGEVETQSNEGA